MHPIISKLFEVQQIELGPKPKSAKNKAEVKRLREEIPVPIQGHYDRLMKRGKKGVSPVRNGTCTGCYMKLASGQFATLLRAEDVMICDSCGRYLHVSEEEIKAALEPEKKPVKKRAVKKKTATKKKAAKKKTVK